MFSWSSLVKICMHAQLLQLCPTLCDPVDNSPPGSSVHKIIQARILEWVAMHTSKGSACKDRCRLRKTIKEQDTSHEMSGNFQILLIQVQGKFRIITKTGKIGGGGRMSIFHTTDRRESLINELLKLYGQFKIKAMERPAINIRIEWSLTIWSRIKIFCL